MKNSSDLSRREFLHAAAATSGGVWLRLGGASVAAIAQAACTAREEAAPFDVLGEEDAADLAAIAARIIPTTDTPGANEAGVVHFFDQAFAGEASDQFEYAVSELGNFNDSFDGLRFTDLDAEEQDAALASIEGGEFFEMLRLMTIYGFFAMSSYGGNKNHVAWDLIGFSGHKGAWEYPFGDYDAEVHGEPADG